MKNYILPLMLAASTTASAQADNSRPNIILILADDMGYSDLGAYGSEIRTPNLDRLAAEGTRFCEFYNNSISAPTRASLLTGQFQHKAGVGYFANNLGLPAYQGYINNESLTFAEVLQQGGYHTYLSGKWHVSGRENGNEVSQPWQRGFEHSYNVNNGSYFDQGDYLPDGATAEQKLAVSKRKRPYYKDGQPVSLDPGSYYATDLITDNAVNYINEQTGDKPFVLYLAYTAPHWPLHAQPEDIAKYKGVYDEGWDVIREKRFEKQKQLGIIPQNAVLPDNEDNNYKWASLSYDRRNEWVKKMEVYAAMIDRLDQGVGKVLNALKAKSLDDNTLIIFLSDNGAPAEDLIRWHNGASRNSGPIGTIGSSESQSRNWSHLSNTPLRAYKDFVYEGGIRTPFIAWFPKRIKAGRIAQGTGHIIDLAPTFYDLAGVSYPTEYNGTKTNALHGKSLLPVLTEGKESVEREEPLCWERAGNRAVRQGKWKLESHWPNYSWELFDLETDPGETHNVAARNHEVVSKLSQAYFKWAEDNGVVDFRLLEKNEPKMMKAFRQSMKQKLTSEVPANSIVK
jgi:arylsulfatase